MSCGIPRKERGEIVWTFGMNGERITEKCVVSAWKIKKTKTSV
jgi:hypothetical protein